jgi:hypothetical protein
MPVPPTSVPRSADAPDSPSAAEHWDEHAKMPEGYVGENTPSKGKRQKTSAVWNDVKRLIEQHPLDKKGDTPWFTHICCVKIEPGEDGQERFCNQLIKCYKTKANANTGAQSWLTTKPGNHLTECHPVDSSAGAAGVQRTVVKNDDAMDVSIAYGMPDGDGGDTNPISKMKLSKRERSLTGQAQWYVYSSMRVSKQEFEGVFFQAMLKETGDGDKTAILTQANLKTFVRAEWGAFLLFLKLIFKMKYGEALGNPFAQALHDGGTLVNKKKFQALAVQLIAPKWKKNLVITIGLIKSLHNKDADVAALWRKCMLERTGHTYDAVVARMRSDRAAKGVAGSLDMDEEEVCEMHDTDKLGRSAIGALVRTRMKVAVNPFPEGAELVQRAHKLGTYFGYSTRAHDLSAVGKAVGNCPDLKIQVDYNTTRIAAVHGLLYSELRLNRALKAYELKYTPKWEFKAQARTTHATRDARRAHNTRDTRRATRDARRATLDARRAMRDARCARPRHARARDTHAPESRTRVTRTHTQDWHTAAEFEAVLNATKITSTLAQIEKHFMAAYTRLIKELAMTKLRAAALDVISLEKVTSSPKLEREKVAVADLSQHGQTARMRATLEGERRWCGNKGETLTGASIMMGRHEKLAMLLDKRTLGCNHVCSDVRQEAVEIFNEEYVKFYKQAVVFEAQQLAEIRARETEATTAAPAGAAAVPESSMASGNKFTGTTWSDDEEDNESEPEMEVDHDAAALSEARRVFKCWKKHKVDWRELYPHLKANKAEGASLDLVEDLMRLDVGKLYNEVTRTDLGRKLFGFIPLMASSSSGQLGALSAESYCERVLSCANNVLVTGNTLLSDEEVEMLVVLRMNREFMQFMRENYAAEIKEAFGRTVVRDS